MASCGSRNKSLENHITKETSKEKISDAIDERSVISFESDSLSKSSNINHYLITKFDKDYEGLNDKDIVSFKLLTAVTIKKFGSVQIYSIGLSENLPEVFTKRNYLIVNVDKKQAALFLVDTLYFIKNTMQDTDVLLAGVEMVKSKGFYVIYDFMGDNKFKEILNTLDYCKNCVPVFNSSTDCKSYKPFMLTFKNTDINNDGLLDINFSGEVASYCKGLETGYGRNDRAPVELNKINFTFILKDIKDNYFEYDFPLKDSICNLIK